jgi:hypothetical protein
MSNIVLIRASVFIRWLLLKLGLGYVYSATGQVCTVELLKSAQVTYGKTMGEGYFQKNGDYTKGRCARWIGKFCFDCSGLIKAARKAISGVWQDLSAQGLYDQCITKRGVISTMPLIPGTLVFMYQSNKERIVHVGVYVGNGEVIESRGVDYGVVKTKLSSRAWTHWGQVSWIELDIPDEKGKAVAGSEKDCGDNSTPKQDDIEILVENMILDGIVSDKDYWAGVLRGQIVPKSNYLQIAFQKATNKI